MEMLKYITKTKKERECEEFSNKISHGAIIGNISKSKPSFVWQNFWWLRRLPCIVAIVCLLILMTIDVRLTLAYIGAGMMLALYLWPIHYFITTRTLSDPHKYEWLTYSVFWIIIAILIFVWRMFLCDTNSI